MKSLPTPRLQQGTSGAAKRRLDDAAKKLTGLWTVSIRKKGPLECVNHFGLFTAGGFATPGSQHPDFTQSFEFGYLTLSNVAGFTADFDNLSITVTQTPLPGALPLFATGLGALGLLGWRRKRKRA